MIYERKHRPPVSRAQFTRRLAWHGGGALALPLISLGGGMGPVDLPKTAGGKLFADCYALYAGLLFTAITALVLSPVLSPVLHRVLHHFHWDDKR